MLNRLLDNIHPAINKNPQANPAISVSGSGTIIIQKDIIQLIGSTASAQFDLRGYTLGSLTSAINQVTGFSATCLAPSTLGALVLISGTYSTPTTLNLFTSLLWQLMKPVAIALISAFDAKNQVMQEIIMTSSNGSWLDSFGEIFGVLRETEEPDSLYTARIFSLSVGIRVNNIAIKKALHDVQYESDINDNGSASFSVRLTIPTNPPQGFVYSTAQIKDIIDQLRPAGVDYEILSQGTATDSMRLTETISWTKTSGGALYGVRKWGQAIW